MANETIGSLRLQQTTVGFVTQLSFDIADGASARSSQSTDDILPSGTRRYRFDPGDLGVADGATVTLRVSNNHTDDIVAEESLIYKSGDLHWADYIVNGNAKAINLIFNGVFDGTPTSTVTEVTDANPTV